MSRPSPTANQAMTLIELLVVVAVVAIVLSMLLPLKSHPVKSREAFCFNNLQQVDLGFLVYAGDNNGKFPIQSSITNGGTMEFLSRNQTFPQFQKVSNYIRSPRLLVCPLDKIKRVAADFEDLTDTNISYFLNADVSTNGSPVSIEAGDRNLQVNDRPVPAGLFVVTTNLNMNWTREMHVSSGGLAYADGHTGFSRGTDLNSVIKRQGVAISRLSVP